MAKTINYYKKIEELISKTPRPIYIAFAIHCARDVLTNIKDEKIYSECYNALAITEAFNQGLATQAEVEAAYSAAYSAANAAHAANAAYSAAYSAANAARSAAYSAYYAAHSAAHAANAAYSTAYDDKIKQYYGVLCGMLRNLTKLERIIFNVEGL